LNIVSDFEKKTTPGSPRNKLNKLFSKLNKENQFLQYRPYFTKTWSQLHEKDRENRGEKKVDCASEKLNWSQYEIKFCRPAIVLSCRDLTQQKVPSREACAAARANFVKAYSKAYASAHEGAGDLAKELTQVTTLLKNAGTFAYSQFKEVLEGDIVEKKKKQIGELVDKKKVQINDKYGQIRAIASVR